MKAPGFGDNRKAILQEFNSWDIAVVIVSETSLKGSLRANGCRAHHRGVSICFPVLRQRHGLAKELGGKLEACTSQGPNEWEAT